MSHKIAASELTFLLLKPESQFQWQPSSDRISRYTEFLSELQSKFAVIAWSGSAAEISTSKIELLLLCAGAELRKLINELRKDEPSLSFSGLTDKIMKKLHSDESQILLLSELIFTDQHTGEQFQSFYDRVQDKASKINWSTLTPDNIKNVLTVIALSCGGKNPYVKGHCLSIRDFKDINLKHILSTAEEFETKHPAFRKQFPQKCYTTLFGQPIPNVAPPVTGPPFGASFGAAPASSGSGLFGSTPTTKPPAQQGSGFGGGGLFGGGTGSFGSAPHPDPPANGGLFGATAKPPAPSFSFGNATPGGGSGSGLFRKSPSPVSAGAGPTSFEEHKAKFFVDPGNSGGGGTVAAVGSSSDSVTFSFKSPSTTPTTSSTPGASFSYQGTFKDTKNIFMSNKEKVSTAPLASAIDIEGGEVESSSSSKRARSKSEDKGSTS
eukprot:sb/3464809/